MCCFAHFFSTCTVVNKPIYYFSKQDGTTTSANAFPFGDAKFPVYRKEDDANLFLAHTDVKYAAPYVFWGGPHFGPGTQMGNIKLGSPFIKCPEEATVCCLLKRVFKV